MLPYRTVVLELTEQCPHACRHCYNFWRDDRAKTVTPQTLDRTALRDLVRRIKKETALEQVAISGGEPLLSIRPSGDPARHPCRGTDPGGDHQRGPADPASR